jgi:predicted Fe-S protein YdhL (DUF1289 family)
VPQTVARLPHSALLRFTGAHNMPWQQKDWPLTDSPFMTVHSRIDIETPCVKVCVLDPESGYCIGCGRTRHEIAGWLDMTDQLRRDIMAGLPQRVDSLTRAKRRRGGARARRGEGL